MGNTAMEVAGQCCKCMMLGIFIIFLMIFTTIIRIPPRTFLESVYIPSLDKDANSSTDTTLTFKVKFKNQNPATSLYYDIVNVTFYDGPQRLHTLANFTAPPFHQHGASVNRGGTVNTTGLDTKAALLDISANGYWVLRVDLATSLKYKFLWKSRTKHYLFGANVHVGDTGIKVHHKKGAHLKSGASATKICGSVSEQIASVLIMILVTCFLCSFGA